MLTVKEKGILLYIIDYCKRIETKIVGATRETFDDDIDITEIVCFNILQIGELAKRLNDDFITKYNGVPWKNIKGMRDKVAHEYGTIDLDQVWNAATNDIKPLREYCEKIINEN